MSVRIDWRILGSQSVCVAAVRGGIFFASAPIPQIPYFLTVALISAKFQGCCGSNARQFYFAVKYFYTVKCNFKTFAACEKIKSSWEYYQIDTNERMPPCPFTCSFYAFWPQINWSESRKSTKQRVKGRERESLPANPDCSWTGLVNGACGVALLTVLSRSKLHAAIIRKSSSYGNACYANTIMNNYVHAPEYIYFSLFSRPELSLGRLWVESKVSPRGSPCEKHKSHVTATPTKAIFGIESQSQYLAIVGD